MYRMTLSVNWCCSSSTAHAMLSIVSTTQKSRQGVMLSIAMTT